MGLGGDLAMCLKGGGLCVILICVLLMLAFGLGVELHERGTAFFDLGWLGLAGITTG